MNIQTIIILLLIGLMAGYLSGLMGLGGGIIIIPALVYLLNFSQQTAQGTTLGLMVLPIGLVAALEYHKHGFIDFRAAILITVMFVVGSYFGSRLAIGINQALLKKIFSVLLIVIAVKMFFDHR